MPNRCGFIHIRSEAKLEPDLEPDNPDVEKLLNTRQEKFRHLLEDKKQVSNSSIIVFLSFTYLFLVFL